MRKTRRSRRGFGREKGGSSEFGDGMKGREKRPDMSDRETWQSEIMLGLKHNWRHTRTSIAGSLAKVERVLLRNFTMQYEEKNNPR